MTPKLGWTALTRRAHVLHPNELGKGHPYTQRMRLTPRGKICRSVLINACIHNHKFTNGSGREAHTSAATHAHTHVWCTSCGCIYVWAICARVRMPLRPPWVAESNDVRPIWGWLINNYSQASFQPVELDVVFVHWSFDSSFFSPGN